MTSSFVNEFKARTIFSLGENTPRVQKCLMELEETELWRKPNAYLNSIGNLILHLCGNMTQYVLSSLGGLPDTRQRTQEFTTKGGVSKDELMHKLMFTVGEVTNTINEASEESMLKERMVQGFSMSGIGIIIHVTEHYSYHTGQIAFWTKMLKNKDLGFYAGIDLNIKNAHGH